LTKAHPDVRLEMPGTAEANELDLLATNPRRTAYTQATKLTVMAQTVTHAFVISTSRASARCNSMRDKCWQDIEANLPVHSVIFNFRST
jgi:hypothetical protein